MLPHRKGNGCPREKHAHLGTVCPRQQNFSQFQGVWPVRRGQRKQPLSRCALPPLRSRSPSPPRVTSTTISFGKEVSVRNLLLSLYFMCNILLKISILRFLLMQQEGNHFAPALRMATGWEGHFGSRVRPASLGPRAACSGSPALFTQCPPAFFRGTPLEPESWVNLLRETLREKIKIVAFLKLRLFLRAVSGSRTVACKTLGSPGELVQVLWIRLRKSDCVDLKRCPGISIFYSSLLAIPRQSVHRPHFEEHCSYTSLVSHGSVANSLLG